MKNKKRRKGKERWILSNIFELLSFSNTAVSKKAKNKRRKNENHYSIFFFIVFKYSFFLVKILENIVYKSGKKEEKMKRKKNENHYSIYFSESPGEISENKKEVCRRKKKE